jgi:ATP-dependent phosphofructokinase / diphosphate-dependent phosphofructokinase
MAKIAVLTGGGDCPGLNAVIRAVVRRSEEYGLEVMGIREGWRGLLDPPIHERLNRERVRGILHLGGTVLGTSRVTPFKKDADGKDRVDEVLRHIERLNIEAIIAIGGEGTLGAARDLAELGFPIVGVPKTIDNDMAGTEMTFGFQTAVQICTDAIDRLHTTAEAHDRVMVVEVMGRHAGHIAVWAGIAGGATVTLIPEEPFDVEAVCDAIRRRHEAGRFASIVVVAEGAVPVEGTIELPAAEVDIYGHQRLGGIGTTLGHEIERRTGYETRVTILGHVQRGGTPNAYDRVLATRYGVAAIDLIHEGLYGHMVCLQADHIGHISLAEAKAKGLKTVDPQLYEVARVFFAA